MKYKCGVCILWYFVAISMVIFVILVLCFVEFHVVASCVYGDGPACRFPCRCKTGGCDPVTGTCTTGGCVEVPPSGYGYGWKGVGCRIGNIAYNKSTSQSGVWNGHTSDRAVDGNTDPFIDHGSCAHPITSRPNTAWWMVDLGKKYVIEKIVIFNRNANQYRTTYFDIRIGMTSTIDEQDLCLSYIDGAKDVIPLTCTEDVTEGRYVSMRRHLGDDNIDPESINICEFVVIGYEPIECSDHCSDTCNNGLEGCDTCDAGFKLPDCVDECDQGTWGTNCVNQCSDTCTSTCNIRTGCDTCAAGYKPPGCVDVCNPGKWGVNCINTCGQCAEDQACNREDGECDEGCEQWYFGGRCDEFIDQPAMTESAVNIEVTSSATLTVTWQQYDIVHDDLAEHYFYKVKYGPTGINKTLSRKLHHDLNVANLHLELTGLTYNTEYEIHVIPYRIQGDIVEIGVPSKVLKRTTQCKGPSVPFMNVTTNSDTWTMYFTPPQDIESGCDVLVSYTLYVAHETTIVHSLSLLNDSTSAVNLPFKYVYVEATVWIEAINNDTISSNSKREILYVRSSTVATTIQTSLNEDETNKETQDNTVLVVGCVIGLLGFAALVVAMVLTLRRSKLCAQRNTSRQTEMTNTHENAKTDDRNDIIHVSPDYENTKHPKKHETDLVDQVASGNTEYEVIPGQQTANQYETLDVIVQNRDVTSTVYQTIK